MDETSGVQLYAKNDETRLPIASMCKIMTLLLAFEAVDCGELTYEEEITVSERAAGMGGSQVFLGAGLSYRTDELLKSIAVCSANDSCVAIAERIAGSEGAFCAEMNERAKELGAENTLFANCTGLPKEPQYSCAKDVALMLRALHKYEKYHEYSHIWLEDFVHPDGRTTQMTNTNKLIRSYQGCAGGKTGFTNEAGFCLAAAAQRGETQVISVVVGADSSQNRFSAVSSLFDYAFDNFESVTKAIRILSERDGLSISARRQTISTSGIAPKIKKLGMLDLGVQLAISLHAVDDTLRSRLIPMNKAYNIAQVLDEVRAFPVYMRKRVMFEYLMIKDLNDSLKEAKKLLALLNGIRAKVNVILFNPHEGSEFLRPSEERAKAFADFLTQRGLLCTIRESKGLDISAACGQLREKVRAQNVSYETKDKE